MGESLSSSNTRSDVARPERLRFLRVHVETEMEFVRIWEFRRSFVPSDLKCSVLKKKALGERRGRRRGKKAVKTPCMCGQQKKMPRSTMWWYFVSSWTGGSIERFSIKSLDLRRWSRPVSTQTQRPCHKGWIRDLAVTNSSMSFAERQRSISQMKGGSLLIKRKLNRGREQRREEGIS